MMTEGAWWLGEDSVLNHRALDFILALHGLAKAYRRLQDDDHDPHLFVECSWWIGAATEACGRRKDGTVLEGFYWVRNKGFHETRLALAQILPGYGSTSLGIDTLGVGPLGGPELPPRWAHLDGPEDGSRKPYNSYLASRSIVETIDEAYATLLREFEVIRRETGIERLR